MAAEFSGLGLYTDVGDVPPEIEASGEFTAEEPSHLGSRGFLYPDNDHQGIVSPHLVHGGTSAKVLPPGRKTAGPGVEQVTVSMHKLHTSSDGGVGKGSDHFSSHGLVSYSEDAYRSPSPLLEPAFEPYVICTKTRSETSCSNESQCSSSSGERLESWTPDKDLRPVLAPMPSSGGAPHNLWNEPGRSYEGEEHIRCASPTQFSVKTKNCHDDYDGGNFESDGGNERVTMLVSASHDSPQFLCKTKPVLPPPEDVLTEEVFPPSSPLFFPSVNPPPSSPSSSPIFHLPTTPPSSSSHSSNSELHASLGVRRARALTFHHCKAGEEEGQFNADYLGMKDIDMYTKSINSVAKELAMSQRPKEVQVFVTSERIRLAPPNSPTLFRSFMVKDILLVRRCSKNKRIIGVMVWKRKVGVPSCHILRCQDDLVASALYNSVWQQTQKVDEVAFSKTEKSSSLVPRPLSTEAQSSDDSGQDYSLATEVLHKFPAVYIGSMATPKAHTADTIVEKVLMESKPSQAKFVTISLSLVEIRYVEDRKELAGNSRESDGIFLSHDTCRIRSMGAYGGDKRFASYVIKEEGKPLLAHVIKCNSAALMVSFTSFLRQSCQLASHQRGGAFYEELSTDESEEWDTSGENPALPSDNPGIVKRIRSLTSSISHLTTLSTTSPAGSTSPTFQSHMHPFPATPPTTTPDTNKKLHDLTPQLPGPSPQDFSDDEYARFPVTYIGSATQESALTQQSVVDAMNRFAAEGTAAGRAAVVKNTVLLQVSLLGINLTDKTHKMFIHRNYPCKSIAGYCRGQEDPKVFAFASHRPGYPNIVKVHVFQCGTEPVGQILDAMSYWLEVDPITS